MSTIDVKVPDIGDFSDVPIIEILVGPGDEVAAEDPLITLESDKATLEVPSPSTGKIAEILVKVGDKVSKGTKIARLEETGGGTKDKSSGAKSEKNDGKDAAPAKSGEDEDDKETSSEASASETSKSKQPGPSNPGVKTGGLPPPVAFTDVHASPSVRRVARELDVDLTKLKGSGEKGRITKEDVKRALSGGAAAPAAGGMGIPEIPTQDFGKFGPIEVQKMSRLKKLSGPHLHRSWLNIPHVTHNDEADITDLEVYRKTLDGAAKSQGYRVTLLAFLMKAAVIALKEYPAFNSSMGPDKDALILKKYYNIGVAVDTPDGLVVPAIKDVDRKGIIELSRELGEVSARMRDGKITPADIQGATFSISSLGGIGGTSFTPIVNAPEVAILGVVRAATKPVWDGTNFVPRLMLPLCVSYDHRVVDGALAARFTRKLADSLSDMRQLIL